MCVQYNIYISFNYIFYYSTHIPQSSLCWRLYNIIKLVVVVMMCRLVEPHYHTASPHPAPVLSTPHSLYILPPPPSLFAPPPSINRPSLTSYVFWTHYLPPLHYYTTLLTLQSPHDEVQIPTQHTHHHHYYIYRESESNDPTNHHPNHSTPLFHLGLLLLASSPFCSLDVL